MRYEHSLLISAPASVVWDLTVDIERWPDFTPTMQHIELLDPAPLGVGGRARIKQPMQPKAIWTVTEFEPGSRLVWETRHRGLTLAGAHLVEDVDGDTCRNTLSVEATGRAAGPFTLLFGATLRRFIARENEGFRAAAVQR
ncbi:SRPBCC family protein [Glycomyces buryatensis]|uniref:Polyketide cyclase n=1 Tax=Glycomyces buryatensis TaxID=2570927 RepID=A0A4V4HSL7_9ACTN|nr:SRPBCC family protein [Glycomyces buryatensis]THV42176.1 hypothetical protein FAB82_08050 [Glycomyces buryatensis]